VQELTNVRKCPVTGPCLVMRSYSLSVGVLIHPRRSEKAEQEVQSGDGFVGTRQKELQSLFKMKTRTPRGHD